MVKFSSQISLFIFEYMYLLLIPVHGLAWYWWHQAHSRPPWSTPSTTRSCPDGTSWSRAPRETYKGGRIETIRDFLSLKPVILSVSADAFPCVGSDEVDLKLPLILLVYCILENTLMQLRHIMSILGNTLMQLKAYRHHNFGLSNTLWRGRWRRWVLQTFQLFIQLS